MHARMVYVSTLMLTLVPLSAWSDLACDPGFRAVEQMLKVNEFADDLDPLVIFENGQEITLATGGEGYLSTIVNSWLWEHNGIFTEQMNSLDFEALDYDQADTDVELLSVSPDGRITMQFCLPSNTKSTTIHAVYADTSVRGIQSSVGHVRDGRINAVANRATGAWFSRFNEGREHSGSEQMLRIMQHHFGMLAPRAVTERQVIALNEMYSAALSAEQLTGGNDLNVDVEGNTVYVEDTPTRMCFTEATTSFLISGVELLVDQCVTGLENHRGERYLALTNGFFKTGTIENAELGMTLVSEDCEGTTGSASVTYGYWPIDVSTLNIRTVFRQNGQDTVVAGQYPEFLGTCDELTIITSVLGNQERELYRNSFTVLRGR